jgi:hypothetical protein
MPLRNPFRLSDPPPAAHAAQYAPPSDDPTWLRLRLQHLDQVEAEELAERAALSEGVGRAQNQLTRCEADLAKHKRKWDDTLRLNREERPRLVVAFCARLPSR